jgi:hypothetical protein
MKPMKEISSVGVVGNSGKPTTEEKSLHEFSVSCFFRNNHTVSFFYMKLNRLFSLFAILLLMASTYFFHSHFPTFFLSPRSAGVKPSLESL